jgi:hypothetical protein
MKSSDVQSPSKQAESWAKKMDDGDKRRSKGADWQETPIEDVQSYKGHDPFSQLRRAFPKRTTKGRRAVAFDAAERRRWHHLLDVILHLESQQVDMVSDALRDVFPDDSRELSARRSYQADHGKCGKACQIRDGKLPISAFKERLRREGRSYGEFVSALG